MVARGAGKLMEKFYKDGYYPEMKRLERKIELIKTRLKEQQDKLDQKRCEYSGVIGKFVSCNVYETNHVGLNDYLNDIGLLVHTVSIDQARLNENPDDKALAEPFLIPGSPYVRFNPNKEGRVIEEDLSYLGEDPELLIEEWRKATGMLKTIEKMYEKLKSDMMNSRLLKKERKLPLSYGSVSLIDGKPSYNIESIFKYLGADFIIRYGKVDMSMLDEFITMRFIQKREVDQFRRIVDIQQRFVLIEQEAENRMYQFFNSRLQRIIRKSIAG